MVQLLNIVLSFLILEFPVWGEAKESSSEEFPTFNLPLWLTSPNVVPDSKNATEETIMKVSGNGMQLNLIRLKANLISFS